MPATLPDMVFRDRNRGQATVEAAGLAVLIAVAIALIAWWIVPALAPPARPPDPIGVVARPLEVPAPPSPWSIAPDGSPGVLSRATGDAARIAARTRAVGARLLEAADRGAEERLEEIGRQLVRDPVDLVRMLTWRPPTSPPGVATTVGRDAPRVIAWARDLAADLEGRSRIEVAERLSEEAGARSVDLLLRRVVGAWTGRAGRRPPDSRLPPEGRP